MSAEYILAGGNEQVIPLRARHTHLLMTATRNTLDLSAVPLLKSMTHLPVIVDPEPCHRHCKTRQAHGWPP